ncbi:MAG: TldD/PmbA family protein [Lachnospiraceae bacterium]|nr:TldD/PmbA family protein [Lachnospiraceae bacterium]
MFEFMDTKKPLYRRLTDALSARFAYASVLAEAHADRSWSISRSGASISTRGMTGGTGCVARVFDDLGCLEYSFNELEEESVPVIVLKMEEMSRRERGLLPAGTRPLPTPLPEETPACFRRETAWKTDPWELGDEAILEKLRSVRETGLAVEGILDVNVRVNCKRYRQIFLSAARDLDQTVLQMSGSVTALAVRGQEIKYYSRPYSILGGAEMLETLGSDVEDVCRAALELLDSEPMVPGEYECVCDPAVTGMIVHEAFGHGVEMDMFVKDRAQARQFVGRRVASDLVTMHDGSAVGEVATRFFDEEGSLTTDTVIIDHGILKQGISDALSAARLGTAPTGNGRRESYERKAYTRMTNTYFEAGTSTPEEMIASVKYGFLLQNPASGMEDPKNWGIQLMVNVAREIRDGKLTGRIFSPIVLTGYVPDLLKSVSMMGRDVELSGSGHCGKGYKEWVKVSDGGPYMKARIRLG